MAAGRQVVVFAGPSGGHIFPAVAFSEVFQKKLPRTRIHLVTSRRGEVLVSKIRAGLFEEVYYLPEFPFAVGISLQSIRFLLELPRAFILSSYYLSKIKPDLAVGFGSFVSYPGMMLSIWRGIPTLIHEQNRISGKTTSWLARDVDCVAVSFEETLATERWKRREFVGLPLRSNLGVGAGLKPAPTMKDKNQTGGLFSILVVGGSQGAHRLNQMAIETFSRLTPEEKQKFAVIHITGLADYPWVQESYQKLGISSETYPFFDNMRELYQKADLAITRAGANTLFELALFKLPALVIPYPYAGAHQKANAEFFASRSAILLRDEANLTSESLLADLRRLNENPAEREKLSYAIEKLAQPEASERLVELSEELMHERH